MKSEAQMCVVFTIGAEALQGCLCLLLKLLCGKDQTALHRVFVFLQHDVTVNHNLLKPHPLSTESLQQLHHLQRQREKERETFGVK